MSCSNRARARNRTRNTFAFSWESRPPEGAIFRVTMTITSTSTIGRLPPVTPRRYPLFLCKIAKRGVIGFIRPSARPSSAALPNDAPERGLGRGVAVGLQCQASTVPGYTGRRMRGGVGDAYARGSTESRPPGYGSTESRPPVCGCHGTGGSVAQIRLFVKRVFGMVRNGNREAIGGYRLARWNCALTGRGFFSDTIPRALLWAIEFEEYGMPCETAYPHALLPPIP
ncbi:MAG: hypothetical protein BWY76_01133 [bacterium ADurb.Bin429]|nr:MAG: hypothetical protein BWY76_01133 [bacterium ADurb.Bin429]